MPKRRGTAGMKADPSCNRQAISPVLTTARLAHVPRKIPNAVQTCQDMTNPPRIFVGEFSAENTGTVTSFNPIPIPRSTRQAASWPQCWVNAEPMGATKLNTAAMKMVPLRPMAWLIGSDSQPALIVCQKRIIPGEKYSTYAKQIVMYGTELINPTIHWFLSHTDWTIQCSLSLGIPNCLSKVRLAPLEPIHRTISQR